jgi:hypothetical protein
MVPEGFSPLYNTSRCLSSIVIASLHSASVLGTDRLLLDHRTPFFVIAVRVQGHFSYFVSEEPIDLFERETFGLGEVEERRDYKDAHCAEEVKVESARED